MKLLVMHTNSDSIEIMISNETEEIIEELLQRYQELLEVSMKGSDSVFDHVDILY